MNAKPYVGVWCKKWLGQSPTSPAVYLGPVYHPVYHPSVRSYVLLTCTYVINVRERFTTVGVCPLFALSVSKLTTGDSWMVGPTLRRVLLF